MLFCAFIQYLDFFLQSYNVSAMKLKKKKIIRKTTNEIQSNGYEHALIVLCKLLEMEKMQSFFFGKYKNV
jgi:hypothetical protein